MPSGSGSAGRSATRCWAFERWDGKGDPLGLTGERIVLPAVLGYVARGLSNKEIAQRLFISPKTVRNHVEHINTKIGVSSRAAAGFIARERGLLPEAGAQTIAAPERLAGRP